MTRAKLFLAEQNGLHAGTLAGLGAFETDSELEDSVGRLIDEVAAWAQAEREAVSKYINKLVLLGRQLDALAAAPLVRVRFGTQIDAVKAALLAEKRRAEAYMATLLSR